jgi:Sugar kinases, ribokinase family
VETPWVAVVGGVNLDILGRSFAPLIPADSNPGAVRLSLGGVGRNVAHNLALLGTRVFLLTALAGDGWEARIRAGCAAAGIDLSRACRVPAGVTSTYLAIEGPAGDLELAICDNTLADHITPAYLEGCLDVLNGAAAVVLDANLRPETLAWLAERCTAPLFADPVSVTKAEKLRPILDRLFLCKPNRLEAELLSGLPITDRPSLELAAEKLLAAGLRRVCISLGSRGLYCAWGEARCLVPCPETKLVNASGGGDALAAGLVRAFLDSLPPEEAARFALACSAIAVEGEDTINPSLSLETVQKRLSYRGGNQQ